MKKNIKKCVCVCWMVVVGVPVLVIVFVYRFFFSPRGYWHRENDVGMNDNLRNRHPKVPIFTNN